MQKGEKRVLTLRDLYPHLSPEELAEVEERIDRYLEIVIRIVNRISEDPEALAELDRLIEESKKTSN